MDGRRARFELAGTQAQAVAVLEAVARSRQLDVRVRRDRVTLARPNAQPGEATLVARLRGERDRLTVDVRFPPLIRPAMRRLARGLCITFVVLALGCAIAGPTLVPLIWLLPAGVLWMLLRLGRSEPIAELATVLSDAFTPLLRAPRDRF